MSSYTLHHVGDQALLVEFENEISIAVNQKVGALKLALEEAHLPGVQEIIPTYRTILIHYDPLTVSMDGLRQAIDDGVTHMNLGQLPPAIVTEIPVLYEGEYALDLEEIARIEGKTVEEIIKIHSQSDYYVYMLGFAPGHPYTARFENPFSFKRRETPRVKIPGGSIVVQLGLSDIIPFEQPCGWNIIGSTPLDICNFDKEEPFLLSAGDWVRHVPVTKDEYDRIRHDVENGTYKVKTYAAEENV